MDAILFLIKEHDKVRKFFSEISESAHRDHTKREKFKLLAEELIRHEKMEQTVWYPHFKDNEKLEEAVKHLLKEENKAAKAIEALEQIETPEKWEEKFLKLKEDVEHHASEEEQKLFPNVRSILNETQLENIGKEMQQFKQAYNALG